MAAAFPVRRLPRDVQDRIFAFADGCLSRQHRGIPRVCKFWLFDQFWLFGGQQFLGLPARGPTICVLEEQWRAEAAPTEMEDEDALPCQTCGSLRPHLYRVEVGFVELTLHRRITHVPHTDGAVYTVSTQMDFELRDVCDECHEVLLWADEGWRDR